MEYKSVIRKMPVCLECGDKIRYGRTDKKFCCEDCRTRHHNRLTKYGRTFKRKILRVLDRNYDILDALIRSDTGSAGMTDLIAQGFVPDVMTSHRRLRRHDECSCFDIKYIMTPTRISSISKIQNVSLPLHSGIETITKI